MTTITSTSTKRLLALAAAAVSLACCLAIALPAGLAHALDEPEYTPGENYYIDTPEAYENQDVEHERANEMSSSTQYYVSSPFYLHWISPDQVIYEGEDVFIGCEATGLEDLHYEWHLSKDGGATFDEEGLEGNIHTVSGLVPNDPATEPYLFRCTVTNGDGTSTLTADVRVVVLEAQAGSGSGKASLQTGDEVAAAAAIAGAVVCAALALLLVAVRNKKEESGEEA